jgi:hypothetical protein
MAAIHGDNTIADSIRATLTATMTELMAAMASDSPKPLAVYANHYQATMSLPALSVGVNNLESYARDMGTSGTISLPLIANCEIRVHTDYAGGYSDETKTNQLLNSVMNYMMTNARADLLAGVSGFMIIDYDSFRADSKVTFDDSLTMGGRLTFNLRIQLTHVQG